MGEKTQEKSWAKGSRPLFVWHYGDFFLLQHFTSPTSVPPEPRSVPSTVSWILLAIDDAEGESEVQTKATQQTWSDDVQGRNVQSTFFGPSRPLTVCLRMRCGGPQASCHTGPPGWSHVRRKIRVNRHGRVEQTLEISVSILWPGICLNSLSMWRFSHSLDWLARWSSPCTRLPATQPNGSGPVRCCCRRRRRTAINCDILRGVHSSCLLLLFWGTWSVVVVVIWVNELCGSGGEGETLFNVKYAVVMDADDEDRPQVQETQSFVDVSLC